MLKKTGAASPGPAFTVHLEVDYKRVSQGFNSAAECVMFCHATRCLTAPDALHMQTSLEDLAHVLASSVAGAFSCIS